MKKNIEVIALDAAEIAELVAANNFYGSLESASRALTTGKKIIVIHKFYDNSFAVQPWIYGYTIQ